MKKTMMALSAIILLVAVNVWAAGTITQSIDTNFVEKSRVQMVVTFTATADASDGSFPSTATSTDITNKIKGYYLYKLITNPGSTAPTDNYDIVLNDEDGIDLLGGNGANRDTTNSEATYPVIGSQPFAQPILGPITLVITNNSVNSAGIVIKAVFVK
jgi:hypothetical protein